MWNFKKDGIKAATVGTIGILGMSAAGATATGVLIKPWEGREYVAYQDVGGVWTYCDGIIDRRFLKLPPYRYTDAECDAHLSREVQAHEARLNACINPDIEIPDLTKAALISFTYNVGSGAACKSTLVRKVNAGDLKGACDQLGRWVYVKGRVINGLVNRRVRGDRDRVSEKTVCMIGLDPSYKTPLFEKVYVAFKNWKTKRMDDV